MEQTFKVGDRVECIEGYSTLRCGPHTGWTGTIRAIDGIEVIVTWDGKGVRSEEEDQCDVEYLSLIDASPSLEALIAALEAEVKALKGGQDAKPVQPAYAFGDPVEVCVNGEWRDGVIAAPETRCDTYWAAYLDADGVAGSSGDWFDPKDIRPRVK